MIFDIILLVLVIAVSSEVSALRKELRALGVLPPAPSSGAAWVLLGVAALVGGLWLLSVVGGY